ncbi:MAG: ABC-type transport auxiliary lipoprotein family protein [Alphaproteobacteria bacterium]
MMRSAIGKTVLASLFLVLAALGGCVELPGQKEEPPRLYVLTPKSTYEDIAGRVDWQLLVETPIAPAGLNTSRIALQDSPIELRYFIRAHWSDVAPKMVQTLLVESFENSGGIVGVGRDAIGLRSDFVLKTDMREFQAEYPSSLGQQNGVMSDSAPAPTVRVRLNAKLVRMPDRVIVATQTFERSVPAGRNAMESIVAAFDEALGKVLKQVVVWTLTEGKANANRPAG